MGVKVCRGEDARGISSILGSIGSMIRLTRLVGVALLAWYGVAFAGEDAEGRRAAIELRQRVDALTGVVKEFQNIKRDADQIKEEIGALKKQLELGVASADAMKQ